MIQFKLLSHDWMIARLFSQKEKNNEFLWSSAFLTWIRMKWKHAFVSIEASSQLTRMHTINLAEISDWFIFGCRKSHHQQVTLVYNMHPHAAHTLHASQWGVFNAMHIVMKEWTETRANLHELSIAALRGSRFTIKLDCLSKRNSVRERV